jgi:uncharacterized protein YcfJ
MNATRLSSVILGCTCAILLTACFDSGGDVAQANASDAARTGTPREVCTENTVTTTKPAKDEDRVIGTVTGAVVGAVVGNEVGGKGTSQDVATVGGAVVGGYAGNRVQKSIQDNATEQTTKRDCRVVYD